MSSPNYYNYDPIALLIARSTGILGDFKMGVCINIIRNERLVLNEDQIARVLRRYRAHVEFWNATPNIIESDLEAFAGALGQDYNYILQIYETLNWVGLLRHTCGLDSSGWRAVLNQNGIENRTYFGQLSKRCYVLIRSRDYQQAESIIRMYMANQLSPIPAEIIGPYEQIV